MVITSDIHIPSDEELTTQEVNLSSPALRAGAFHLGKYCENQNNVRLLLFGVKKIIKIKINVQRKIII